jgi:hypothetical protein
LNVLEKLLKNINEYFISEKIYISLFPAEKATSKSMLGISGDNFELFVSNRHILDIRDEAGEIYADPANYDGLVRHVSIPDSQNLECICLHIALEALWSTHVSHTESGLSIPQISEELELPIVQRLIDLSNSDKQFDANWASSALQNWLFEIDFFGFDAIAETLVPIEMVSEEPNSTEVIPSGFDLPLRLTKYEGEFVNARSNEVVWKNFRRSCISATNATKLLKMNGEVSKMASSMLQEKIDGFEMPFFHSFQRGIDREPIIAEIVASNYPQCNFVHNSFLFTGENTRHVATPDMVGDGVLCEIKVSTKELSKVRTKYFDQMQWQMHVTGAKATLFVVENRYSEELEFEWIARNDDRIFSLVTEASKALETLDLNLTFDKSKVTVLEVNFNDYLDLVFDGEEEVLPDVEVLNEEDANEDAWSENISEVQILYELRDPPPYEETTQWTARLYKDFLKELESTSNVELAAEKISKPLGDCIAELARQKLGGSECLVDTSARRYGLAWSAEDLSDLEAAFGAGMNLPEIAMHLERDQLGTAFALILKLRLGY